MVVTSQPAPVGGAAPSGRHGSRKIVTVLFVDMVDSTVLSEELDPESFRSLMERYFETADAVVARHGGYTEKFIGDAVMAVFGIPTMHEDDALRAVTAAVELRERLGDMTSEFESEWGATVAIRAGIDSGEAMAAARGNGELYVTGATVNTAARLEQAARPGEVLIGDATHQLVRDAVLAENLGRIPLKGKHEDVVAWRVDGMIPGAAGWKRRLDARLVDRQEELGRLLAAFERAVTRGCQLVTVLGPAGVGKSRLGNEVISRLSQRARVLAGRCLPYGDGITFWPVIEMLNDAAGIAATDSAEQGVAKLRALLPPGRDADLVADRLAGLLGEPDAQPAIQETFWAIRKLLEQLGRTRPVLVVFDDIHWGEPTFLQLLEYLADWGGSARVLLLCLARDELLDARADWTRPRPNADLVSLQPLTDASTVELVQRLLGGDAVDSLVVASISAVAEGNPLYVEETLRMLVETGQLRSQDGRWALDVSPAALSIPPTIQALMSARLDRLDPDELAVLQHAAVVGKVFGWGDVAALCEDERFALATATHLQSLLRRQLIRPRRDEPSGDDAFEFAHGLIRDIAYQQISKAERVVLHQRFAARLEEQGRGSSTDYGEIAGYHFEQAYRTLLELEPPSARSDRLAERAFVPLSAAGLRAYARGDMPAAVTLLRRAIGLYEQGHAERTALLPRLAFAYMETGAFGPLQEAVAEIEVAAKSGDDAMRGHGTILRLWIRLFTEPHGWADLAEEQGTRALRTFTDLHDERGLTMASSLLGLVSMMQARFGEAERRWRQAGLHAQRAGDRREELEALAWVPLTVWAGPTPSEEGLRRCEEALQRADGDKKAMAGALIAIGSFRAALGRFDEAQEALRQAHGHLEEVDLSVWLAGPYAQSSGWVELLAGDPVAAEAVLRRGCDSLQDIGEMSWFSTVAGLLGEALLEQDRSQEAATLADASREAAAPDDVYSQVVWRTVAAKVALGDGRSDEADRLSAEAVDLVRGTDFLHLHWHALLTRAAVLEHLSRVGEAVAAASEAEDAAWRKGNVVAQRRAHDVLTRLSSLSS